MEKYLLISDPKLAVTKGIFFKSCIQVYKHRDQTEARFYMHRQCPSD